MIEFALEYLCRISRATRSKVSPGSAEGFTLDCLVLPVSVR